MDTFNQSKKTNSLLLFLLVVLVVAAGAVGYLFGTSGENSLLFNTGQTPQLAGRNVPDAGPSATTTLIVKWHDPKQISGLQLYFSDTPGFSSTTASNGGYGFGPAYATYYSVGTVTKDNSEIILASMQYDGPSGRQYVLFRRSGSTISLLQKYSPYDPTAHQVAATTSVGTVDSDGLILSASTIDTHTAIPELDFPDTFVGTNARQVLIKDTVHAFDTGGWMYSTDPEVLVPSFTSSLGEVYTSTSTNGFYLKRGPLVAAYRYKPDFMNGADSVSSGIPAIQFTDGTANTEQYTYTTAGGCGSVDYANVVDIPKSSLMVVGTSSKNDAIYTLRDVHDELFEYLYHNFPSDPPLTYDQYLAKRPLLFWYDPFGRLVEMRNQRFVTQAECGKPVIYLYPTHTMPVSVKLYPQGGFTYSDPPYNAGWDVVAEPDGTLHIGFASSSYPFLFWEGRGGIYQQPKQGWVVTKKNVPGFLRTKLAQLGLNANEARDFMDFWVPKMQAKPYYFVTFMGNQTMDTLAPMVIDPKPDTIIRILMDFTPLDKPITVKPYTIKTPARKGFTVIEWGGVLRK